MKSHVPTILGLITLFIAYIVLRAAYDVPRRVSPQGCRMSWMSPSYLLQSEFNTSWTPLALRYSLWLYREVGWGPNQAMGLPVLFIPGSAGSSHQVRSIASSAARQYFSSPFDVSHEFAGRGAKPIDFYAVEFNGDHTAFHGSTIDSQIAYASAAVKYVLSHYPPDTHIIVMGYSMGGIVGTALLPSANIMALITLSTPHTLPPARFDARIDAIYEQNRKILDEDRTPILSICGGAMDMMVSSESCVLPETSTELGVYRRTVFTSALEGAWTGVGHLEIVWCHQVRWHVARAALELGVARTASAEVRTSVLDRWLRDGSMLPPSNGGDAARDMRLKEGDYEVLPGDSRLVLNRPLGQRTYLLPIPRAKDGEIGRVFVLYVAQGRVLDVSPHHTRGLRVSAHHCADTAGSCKRLVPDSLRLLPTPISGKPFPVPDEGADESDGAVFFEAKLSRDAEGWVAVTVDASEDGSGWVTGGFEQPGTISSELNLWGMLLGAVQVPLPRTDSLGSWRTFINFPHLPATVLLVYRLVPDMTENVSCAAPLFSPLLVHASLPSELHYYRLESDRPVLPHTHCSAPYIPPLRPMPTYGLNLTIHSGCQEVTGMYLSIDWWASAGRMATRYLTTLISWTVGIVSLLLFYSWGLDGQKLSVDESLGVFVRQRMPVLMGAAGLVALFPLGPNYYLGIGDELGVLRVALAVILVCLATGVVCASWWLLVVLMWLFRLLTRASVPRKPGDGWVRRSTVISMAIVLALVLLVVPWQVAFVGCWIMQLLNCNATYRPKSYPGSAPTLTSTPTTPEAEDDSARRSSQTLRPTFGNAYNQNTHVLLLMTWLIPLAAPVLMVWVRTLQTAGYTTPFRGDHNVLKVAPVMVLVDLLGRGRPLDTMSGWRRWGWVVVSVMVFLMGGRWGYVVYDWVILEVVIVLMCHMIG